MRELPVITSGPTTGTIGKSACSAIGLPGLQLILAVVIPLDLHVCKLPSTKGVVPDAAIPTTVSKLEI